MSNNVIKTWNIGKSSIRIGRFTYGYENVYVRQWNEGASLTIGSFCSIALNLTVFLGGNHRVDWITTFPFGHLYADELGGEGIPGHNVSKGDVIIGHDVWIGHGVTIMSGIKIGDGAVIGANSMVVKDVAPYEIVGGNPARRLRMRFSDEIISLLLELKWWNLPVAHIRDLNRELSLAPDTQKLRAWITKYRSGDIQDEIVPAMPISHHWNKLAVKSRKLPNILSDNELLLAWKS